MGIQVSEVGIGNWNAEELEGLWNKDLTVVDETCRLLVIFLVAAIYLYLFSRIIFIQYLNLLTKEKSLFYSSMFTSSLNFLKPIKISTKIFLILIY